MRLLLNKKAVLGLALCVLVLSASVPLLVGLRTSPYKMIYGKDVLTLTQVTTEVPLNKSLIENLNQLQRDESWVQMVSPEIYVFCVKHDVPIVVRGVNTTAFLSIESGRITKGSENDARTAMIGEGLSRILGIETGDRVLLTGSTTPAVVEVKVAGMYSTPNPSNDELIISLDAARKLAGIRDDTVMAIRVKTSDANRLIDYLQENKIPAVVSPGTGPPSVLNSNVSYDPRLINTLFQYSDTPFSQDLSLITMFTQQGVSSVSVVVIGFLVLNAGLTFIGISAILARSITEKKKEIGILSAIGASKARIRLFILSDIFLIIIPATIVGIALGLLMAHAVGQLDLILVFGHSIKPAIETGGVANPLVDYRGRPEPITSRLLFGKSPH